MKYRMVYTQNNWSLHRTINGWLTKAKKVMLAIAISTEITVLGALVNLAID
jgi:hypothetical protein